MVYSLNFNGNSNVTLTELFWGTKYLNSIEIADFNGDGKADVMGGGEIGYSTGKGFIWKYAPGYYTAPYTAPNNGPFLDNRYQYNNRLGDFNGDGKTDILQMTFVDGTEFNFYGQPNPNEVHYYTYDERVLYSTGMDFVAACNVHEEINSDNPSLPPTYGIFTPESPYLLTKGALRSTTQGDFNADGKTDLLSPGYQKLFLFNEGNSSDLRKVKNGMDAVTEFDYNRISDPNMAVINAPTNTDPDMRVYSGFPIRAVVETRSSNGLTDNSKHTMRYSYRNPRYSTTGGGFLGFEQSTVKDMVTNYTTISTNEFLKWNKRAIPLAFSSATYYPGGVYVNHSNKGQSLAFTANNTAWVKVYYSYAHNTLEQNQVETQANYDTYGNLTNEITNINGGQFRNTVYYIYQPFGGTIPNRVTKAVSSQTRNFNGNDTYVTTNKYDYYPNGMLKTQTSLADHAQPLQTDFGYDDYGNLAYQFVTAPQ